MICRTLSPGRAVALMALMAAFAGCFNPVREPDCLLDGACECKRRADCAADRDCVGGFCRALPDAGLPGDLGWPCGTNADCRFGPCLPRGPGNGLVCSAECGRDGGFTCEKGWECKTSFTGDGFLCVPPFKALCNVCRTDGDCNTSGDRCLTLNGEQVCGQDCAVVACRAGFSCRAVSLDAGLVRQCVPDSNSCTCSPNSVGLTRSCSTSATLGRCFGVETCQPDGRYSACDAPRASPEVCDGVDNDCNGLTDSADPGLDTSSVVGFPDCRKGVSCTGKVSCGPRGPDAGFAFLCSAPDPSEERCNSVDDDCNGVVDDGLRDALGRYSSARACGGCNTDCSEVLEGVDRDGGAGAAECVDRAGQLTCIPRRCAKGFFLSPASNPVKCEPVVATQCAPCTSTGDCRVPLDSCASVGTDQGRACQQSCAPASPRVGCRGLVGSQDCCPAGSLCQRQANELLCVPTSNSCECSSSRAGFSRSCFVTQAVSTCVGRQTCEASGAYSTCDTSQTTTELCDGADNDCDGLVDDGFINTRGSGTYDSDQYCGTCQTNCLARYSPTIQHAVGGCFVDGGVRCAIARCTSDVVAGAGASCRTSADCGGQETCDPLHRLCVRPCSAGCLSGTQCVGGTCARTCASDSDCRASSPQSTCQTVDGGARVCGTTAQFNDVDLEDTNGCECPRIAGVVDEPDVSSTWPTAGLPVVDRDCDGVDGVAARSLFVWAQSTSSLGTRAAPYRTIREAITAFQAARHDTILVAQGTYVEQVIVRAGVKLHGGYSADFSRRDVINFPTLIEAPQPDLSTTTAVRGTVNAEWTTSSAQQTIVAGFTIRGYDVTARPTTGSLPGFNSYAVYVNVPGGLILQNNHVVGGRGGDGSPGTPGLAGANGGNGSDGLPSRECNTDDCAAELQSGGFAGQNAACSGGTGGNPGAGSNPLNDPQQYTTTAMGNGRGGGNGQYTNRNGNRPDLCKYDCQVPANGLNGGPAQNGGDGSAGSGAVGFGCQSPLGSINGNDWGTASGTSGSGGSVGRGGGGGGAGGCVINTNPTSCTVGRRVGDLGATGGGGGAGGCAGGPGLFGGGGGASFGIFVVSGTPRLIGNLIDLGFGGNGGNGGSGGYGGLGGQGGRGGTQNSAAWCAGQGGPGGRGGNGGAGTGGGGGCGGPVFGVAGRVAAAVSTENSFAPTPLNAPGAGGVGGSSPAGATFMGGAGQPGVTAQVQVF